MRTSELTGSFIVRPYEQDDEDFVIMCWLKSYAWQTKRGGRVDRADNKRFWRQHRHNAMGLLAQEKTLVAVDAEMPSLCWAFACMGDGVVHFFGVKPGLPSWSQDFAEALLGDRLRTRQYASYQMPALQPMPDSWVLDEHCIPYILSKAGR